MMSTENPLGSFSSVHCGDCGDLNRGRYYSHDLQHHCAPVVSTGLGLAVERWTIPKGTDGARLVLLCLAPTFPSIYAVGAFADNKSKEILRRVHP